MEASPSLPVPAGDLYDPGEYWDEAFDADGRPREHYGEVIDRLGSLDLARLGRTISLAAAMRGMAFRGSRGPQVFPLDPVPRIIAPAEHRLLSDGLAQRARALDAFLTDIYSGAEIVSAGVMPERVVESAGVLEIDMREVVAATGQVRTGIAGFDLVRGTDGELRVLEDNLRVPSGIAYATVAREILDDRRVLRVPEERNGLDVADLLGRTLHEAAPPGVDEPQAAVLSDGAGNSAWWEHRRLARELGVPIVSPDDLVAAGGGVAIRVRGTERLLPVHVVYRRTDENRLRDEVGRPTWLGDLFIDPLTRGTVAVVNAFGTAIADDKLVHAYVEQMISFYLDEEPVIGSVPTYDPCEPEQREHVLDRIGELVVKPRNGSGGAGVVVCPHASCADVARAAEAIRTRPEAYVVQETVSLSTHPTVIDGRLAPRHVDLRAFAYGDRVLPGGLTRVALDAGALVVNSSMNGGGKDTWMLS